MLYKNIKLKVHSLDRDTDFFYIVASVQQGDTLAPCLFIICLNYVLRTSIDLKKKKIKRQWFCSKKKARSWRYPTQNITDADYVDDIALLANTPTQAEFLIICLEQAACEIDLHVNSDKTEYMCFNQTTLNSDSLKQWDKLTYHGSSVSSTEIDINIRLEKAWTAIDKLSIIWKSDLSDKI